MNSVRFGTPDGCLYEGWRVSRRATQLSQELSSPFLEELAPMHFRFGIGNAYAQDRAMPLRRDSDRDHQRHIDDGRLVTRVTVGLQQYSFIAEQVILPRFCPDSA